jgi:uncharacterized repeat protein (TIGR03803 family)
VDFGTGNGQLPNGFLGQATDGTFYSTAQRGGGDRLGTAFKMTSTGKVTTLFTFDYYHGKYPYAGMIQGSDGNFYGTTRQGGAHSGAYSGGVVYQITSSGTLNVLYNFCALAECQDGSEPFAALVEGADGNFYGTTHNGGALGFCGDGCGTVFKITPQGSLTTLYSFCSQTACADGNDPYQGLVQGADGNFYGVTSSGGITTPSTCQPYGGCGTIFKISSQGNFTTIYSFCSQPNCSDGFEPYENLMQANGGNLYGMAAGGAYGGGIIFKIDSTGVVSTLHSFCALPNCLDGRAPTSLVQGSDGNLYGTTDIGGTGAPCYSSTYSCGTVFKITTGGTFTTLYSLCLLGGSSCLDGAGPLGMTQGTDGNFYGVTNAGGQKGWGVAFKLSTGLGPFVTAQTSLGAVGSSVVILGSSLTGSTSVTFNGTPASFTVVSATQITATVPTGATSGFVLVTTPSGTLTSSNKFTVTH